MNELRYKAYTCACTYAAGTVSTLIFLTNRCSFDISTFLHEITRSGRVRGSITALHSINTEITSFSDISGIFVVKAWSYDDFFVLVTNISRIKHKNHIFVLQHVTLLYFLTTRLYYDKTHDCLMMRFTKLKMSHVYFVNLHIC